jgi:HlyD family secretion protein
VRSLIPAFLIVAAGCRAGDDSDAFGTFEATEVVVSAEAAGRLLELEVHEGTRLDAGAVVGLVDTTQLILQRQSLVAQRANLVGQQAALVAQERATRAGGTAALVQEEATLAQVAEAQAHAAAIAAQLATAERELARTERLYNREAATERELSLRRGEATALREQLRQARAREASITAQAATSAAQARVQSAQAGVPGAQADAMTQQVRGLEAQIQQIDARIDDASITNPVGGTVLNVVARAGEVVGVGSPLYTVADLSVLTLRAYATGDQLAGISLNAPVDVLFAAGGGEMETRRGAIRWISAEAEFTPSTVRTRDENAELVYAFEVRVPNRDNRLRIGMPAEVRFRAGE